MLDIDVTGQDDLRSRHSPWERLIADVRDSEPEHNMRCDVLVVGGGITGALMAEHLNAAGLKVVLIDRERPGLGSTAASTAMLQWEIDTPLSELTEFYGFDKAADAYRRSFKAVEGLQELVHARGLQCSLRARQTLYLAAGDTGLKELQLEHALRQKAGLPGELLEHRALMEHFGFDREAALVSPGSADADPLCLAQGLLLSAKESGVRVLTGDAVSFHSGAAVVTVGLVDGSEVEAKHVVLATGYVMPDFVQNDLHSVVSSWAITTLPQNPADLWAGEGLVWEASDSYAYMRTTANGRIVIGGEDEEITDAKARDAAIESKSARLQAKLGLLWPPALQEIDTAWAGFFGETEDGLPLIGAVPDHPRIFAAYGYGGNGITFSYMASRIIGSRIEGDRRPWFDMFSLERGKP